MMDRRARPYRLSHNEVLAIPFWQERYRSWSSGSSGADGAGVGTFHEGPAVAAPFSVDLAKTRRAAGSSGLPERVQSSCETVRALPWRLSALSVCVFLIVNRFCMALFARGCRPLNGRKRWFPARAVPMRRRRGWCRWMRMQRLKISTPVSEICREGGSQRKGGRRNSSGPRPCVMRVHNCGVARPLI